MEVIPQQTVGVGIGDWRNMLGVELQEVAIIARLNEYVLPIVAAIVDVEVLVVFERGWRCHDDIPNPISLSRS